MFETHSYIRHGQSRTGTRNGINLYRGLTVKTANNGKNPRLYIEYSGKDMEDYQYDDADSALEYIINGVRFPYWNRLEWKYNYKSKDFSCFGTLQDAINQFDQDFVNIAEKKFYKLWHKLSWN